MCDTGRLVRLAALRHAQGWVSLCADCLLVAAQHQHHRDLQHHPLESPCV
uniref:Uncharacterized protein n=1 Tax=Arundo donax TaxID=35708 RepID=A0A0A9H1A4_ARUDO